MDTLYTLIIIATIFGVLYFAIKFHRELQRAILRLSIKREKRKREYVRDDIKRNMERLLAVEPQNISEALKIEIWDMLWEGVCPNCNGGKIIGGFEGCVPSNAKCEKCGMIFWVTSARRIGAFPLGLMKG